MFTGISTHHAMSLVFTGISIHHARSLTRKGVNTSTSRDHPLFMHLLVSLESLMKAAVVLPKRLIPDPLC